MFGSCCSLSSRYSPRRHIQAAKYSRSELLASRSSCSAAQTQSLPCTATLLRPAVQRSNLASVCRSSSRDTQGSNPVDVDGSIDPPPRDEGRPSYHSLSAEQASILEMVKRGKNVFFTGNAGTGKTFLLAEIIRHFRSAHEERHVAVCAYTGIAATHIGGTTIHSAFGLGVPYPPNKQSDFEFCWESKSISRRIRGWKVLIIDEVSMLSGEMFEILEYVTRKVRGGGKPFGGLQIVLCGDFLQLPPIPRKWHDKLPKDCFLNQGYTFQAPAWERCKLQMRLLTEVFRQKDSTFTDILEAVRYKSAGVQGAMEKLRESCSRELPSVNGVAPTLLFGTNEAADIVNEMRLQELAGLEEVLYEASDEVRGEQPDKLANEEALKGHSFFKECLAAEVIKLKAGAQVMLLRNLDLRKEADEMLVNGSRGVVTGFREIKSKQEVGDAWGEASLLQNVEVGQQVPIVRFTNGRELPISPFTFAEEVTGYGTCSRTQVPLKLAYAITIHKSQGMTLDYVKVDLKGIFQEGQAYVALSRASALEGLQVVNAKPGCVRTNPLAMHFHKCLESGERYAEEQWDDLMELPPQQFREPGSEVWTTEFFKTGSKVKRETKAKSKSKLKCPICQGPHFFANCPKK